MSWTLLVEVDSPLKEVNVAIISDALKSFGTKIPQSRPDLDIFVFVWGIWSLTLLMALAFSWRFGSSVVPYSDEWAWVPVLAGEEPLTVNWLWSQHAEHRMALGKFIWVSLLRLTNGNFRAGLFLNGVILGTLALIMILGAQRLRGSASYSDAFFPLALLNLGQWRIWVFSAHIVHIIPAVLVFTLLSILVRSQGQLTLGRAALAGVCLVLLPLGSATGLPFVLALALWLGYSGVLHWLSPELHNKRIGIVTLGLTFAALLMLAFYFVGYQRIPGCPPSPGLGALLATSVHFLTMSLGPVTASFWEFSAAGVLGFLLVSGGLLIVGWRRRPHERLRALGLLLFMGAMASLALGVGLGRSGCPESTAFSPHYVLLAVPALCCAYFIWGIYGTQSSSRLVQMSLFTVMCMMFPLNAQGALDAGREYRDQMSAFERDLRGGTPAFVLAERYSRFLYPYEFRGFWVGRPDESPEYNEYLALWLQMLKHAGIGQFKLLQDEPTLREVPLAVVPTALDQMTWSKGIGYTFGRNPSLTFTLKAPQLVYAIRLKYSYGPTTDASFQMFWKNTGRNDFDTAERNVQLKLQHWQTYPPTGPGEKTLTVWVNDTIDQFRIQPDTQPGVFRISQIVLLVPIADGHVSPARETRLPERHL